MLQARAAALRISRLWQFWPGWQCVLGAANADMPVSSYGEREMDVGMGTGQTFFGYVGRHATYIEKVVKPSIMCISQSPHSVWLFIIIVIIIMRMCPLFKDLVRYPQGQVGVSAKGGPACLIHTQGKSWSSGCRPDGHSASSIRIQVSLCSQTKLETVSRYIH